MTILIVALCIVSFLFAAVWYENLMLRNENLGLKSDVKTLEARIEFLERTRK